MEKSYIKLIQQQQEKIAELSSIYTRALQKGFTGCFLGNIVDEMVRQTDKLEEYKHKLSEQLGGLYG